MKSVGMKSGTENEQRTWGVQIKGMKKQEQQEGGDIERQREGKGDRELKRDMLNRF